MDSPDPKNPDRRPLASAEEIIFNDNLQEFATKIGYICSLETNGKVPPDQAYQQIRDLWKSLKKSKKNLRIGKPPQSLDSE